MYVEGEAEIDGGRWKAKRVENVEKWRCQQRERERRGEGESQGTEEGGREEKGVEEGDWD